MKILSIEPGASGGLVWRDKHGQVHSASMPETGGDTIDLLRSIALDGVKAAVLEQVGGFVGKAQPGSAMFNFGRNYGFLQGALMAMSFRLELVTPQKWQKPFALGTTKDAGSPSKWKNKIKGVAQRLYPEHRITNKTADAFLIFEWAEKRGSF